MQKVTRVICLVLALMLSVSLLGACGDNDKPDNSDVNANQTLSTADVKYVDAEGELVYRLVRPEDGGEKTGELAKTIMNKFNDVFGKKPRNVTDYESPTGYSEILIGKTNRDATETAKTLLNNQGTGRKEEFIICTVGDDIVIYAENEDTLTTAVNYFAENYVKAEGVAGGINYFQGAVGDFKTVKILGNDRLNNIKIVRPIYNFPYLAQMQIDNFTSYIFEETGYDIQVTHDQVASTTYLADSEAQFNGTGTLTVTTPAEYEIIIGNCKRDGVTAYTDADRSKYEIRIEDNKIFINGGSSHATALAISEFIKLVEANAEITSSMSVLDGNYDTAILNYNNDDYYMPKWHDDFDAVGLDIDPDGFGLDHRLWTTGWNRTTVYGNAPNGKTQYRSSKEHNNTYVKEGKLYYCAVETDTAYYGAWRDTVDTMHWRYGLIEYSSLHAKGMSFWGGLCMYSKPDVLEDVLPDICKDAYYTHEFDIDECYGEGNYVYANIFVSSTEYGNKVYGYDSIQHLQHLNKHYSKDDRGYWMDFHVWGSEWVDCTYVRFFCDGYEIGTAKIEEGVEQATLQQPAYLALAFSVGSGGHGVPTTDPKEWAEANKVVSDWLYIYQKSHQEMYVPSGNTWVLKK